MNYFRISVHVPLEGKHVNDPGEIRSVVFPDVQWKAITGMRGVAALAVVAYHAAFLRIILGHSGPMESIAFRGWFGVDFFFVLSAYLLSGPFLAGRPFHPASYAWRRFARIAPAYWLTFPLIAALANSWHYFRDQWPDFLLHLTFLHGFHPNHILTVNPVYWTLAIELQFYLLLPVLALACKNGRWKWALPVALLLSVFWRLQSGDTASESFWIRNQLPGYAIHFVAGITARAFVPPAKWAFLGAAIVASALLLQPTGFHEFPWEATAFANLTIRPLLAIGFAILIASLAQTRAFTDPVSQAVGTMSYSIYLVHVISQLYFAQYAWGTSWWALLVLPLACSAAYYFVIEKPALRLLRRRAA